MIHNHEVPSSILGRATREPHFCFCKSGALFFPPGQEQALAGAKKQSTLYGIAIQGLSSLGLFCRPLQDHRPQGGNPAIKAADDLKSSHFFVILYKQNLRTEIWRERTEKM